MAEITEAQARRICEAVYVPPDAALVQDAALWPGFPTMLSPFGPGYFARVPAWRIVQRAAAEGGEKSAALSAGEIAPKKGEG